jgi:hypothetical protein
MSRILSLLILMIDWFFNFFGLMNSIQFSQDEPS